MNQDSTYELMGIGEQATLPQFGGVFGVQARAYEAETIISAGMLGFLDLVKLWELPARGFDLGQIVDRDIYGLSECCPR